MFEKDLYALIRGMRNHKGNEKGYIQHSIKECRKEISSQDMDQKATALLKLIYLEMFGYDMSWASFNVLEVMSSAKYPHKRVGYLAAIQSFRPDTEVLMLGENLLKKDLAAMTHPTISLTLATIPHIINASMANSLLADLLSRLTHNVAAIRKKTVVTLYRLALVYPETLRLAWPKIKERLLDDQEHTSVTAAVVNVVCELGWRRPHDFLPLAPRLFDLLVAGGNNWMAIKIIKLFAVLTPLERRLIRKLLSPLTNLIRTTPAMSLLYECINGMILGGILDGSEGTVEGGEIARLCVSKLRGMLAVVGDPNLKYVALLALTKIVDSHPDLVSEHSDVILQCINDPDITIRSRVLDLVTGMVNANNLVPIVEQLLAQLRDSRRPRSSAREPRFGVEPSGEDDDEHATESLRKHQDHSVQTLPLPDDYRSQVIHKILLLCSKETYANISDFEWYVGVLVELVHHCPDTSQADTTVDNVADAIGKELVNIAVRVKTVRVEVAAAAQSLLQLDKRPLDTARSSAADEPGVLGSAAWIAGEYAHLLPDAEAVLASLTHPTLRQVDQTTLTLVVQSVPKVFVHLTSRQSPQWTPARKSQVILIAARVIHFLESLVSHSALQVQERAVEYLELVRLASEAASAHETSQDPPLLFTHVLPSLFRGELNPMAPGALRKVPLAEDLDLDQVMDPDLQHILSQADTETTDNLDDNKAYIFYNAIPEQPAAAAAINTLQVVPVKAPPPPEQTRESLARLKAERQAQYRNDPFYIAPAQPTTSAANSPLHQILKSSNGQDLDIDSIPIMPLDLGPDAISDPRARSKSFAAKKPRRAEKIEIAADETLGDDDDDDEVGVAGTDTRYSTPRPRKTLLEVDSTGLSALSLDNDVFDAGRVMEEEEMKKAMAEVERLRLEMQRDSERVEGGEGTVVKRKVRRDGGQKTKTGLDVEGKEKKTKKKKESKLTETGGGESEKRKKKKKKNVEGGAGSYPADGISDNTVMQQPVSDQVVSAQPEISGSQASVTPKPRRKARQIRFDEDTA